MRAFQTESELTEVVLASPDFLSALGHTDWTRWQRQELDGLFGVPDLVVAFVKRSVQGRELIRTYAFEMKRSKWKRALIQAYKYAAFAHYSYVVMDAYYVHRALARLDEFVRSDIGLVSVSESGQVEWHYHPRYRLPYSDSLRQKLESQITQDAF